MGKRNSGKIDIGAIHERIAAHEAERERVLQEARDKVNASAAARKAIEDAERAEREAELQAAKDRLQDQRAKEFDARHKPVARTAFLATGGTVEEFEKQWPEQREKIRSQVIEDETAKKRRAIAESYRSQWGRF